MWLPPRSQVTHGDGRRGHGPRTERERRACILEGAYPWTPCDRQAEIALNSASDPWFG